jgi:hypothetical protein
VPEGEPRHEPISTFVDQQVVGMVKKELIETQKSNARYFAFFYNRAIVPSNHTTAFCIGTLPS